MDYSDCDPCDNGPSTIETISFNGETFIPDESGNVELGCDDTTPAPDPTVEDCERATKRLCPTPLNSAGETTGQPTEDLVPWMVTSTHPDTGKCCWSINCDFVHPVVGCETEFVAVTLDTSSQAGWDTLACASVSKVLENPLPCDVVFNTELDSGLLMQNDGPERSVRGFFSYQVDAGAPVTWAAPVVNAAVSADGHANTAAHGNTEMLAVVVPAGASVTVTATACIQGEPGSTFLDLPTAIANTRIRAWIN